YTEVPTLSLTTLFRSVPVDEAQPVAVRDPGPELEIGDLEQALVEEADLLERPAPQEHGGGLADPVLLEAGREQLAEEVTPLVDRSEEHTSELKSLAYL